MQTKIKLSLVIPTLGRDKEVDRLLASVERSMKETGSDILYEIIVVDQNEDGRIDHVIRKYREIFPQMRHYKVQFKGVSKARNFGTARATGEIVTYPDDDCELSLGAVSLAVRRLRQTKAVCVCGRSVDKRSGEDSMIRFSRKAMVLSLDHYENCFIEYTMFFRRTDVLNYQFDEQMGVGTVHGAEEGHDLIYRMLKDGCRIVYDPGIRYYHPAKKGNRTAEWEIHRAFYYSCGLGYLCRKHGFYGKYRIRALKLSAALPVIALCRPKQWNYFFAQWMGIRLGYRYI